MVFALTLHSIRIVRIAFSVRWKLDFINDLTQEGGYHIVPNPFTTLLFSNPLKDVRPLVRQNDNLVKCLPCSTDKVAKFHARDT